MTKNTLYLVGLFTASALLVLGGATLFAVVCILVVIGFLSMEPVTFASWCSGFLTAVLLSIQYPNLAPALRRFVLWNVRCRRGRRCASLNLASVVAEDALPPGSVIHMEWNCAACKMRYRGSVLVGQGGAYTESGRTRVRATH